MELETVFRFSSLPGDGSMAKQKSSGWLVKTQENNIKVD
jgi:hypothetical protein